MCVYMVSSANGDTLISSFSLSIPLISFSCLLTSANTLSSVLQRYGDSDQPCLTSNYNGITSSFSPCRMMLAMGLAYIAVLETAVKRHHDHSNSFKESISLWQ